VWLEPVPSLYISDLAIVANLTALSVVVSISGTGGGGGKDNFKVKVSASAESAPGQSVATAHGHVSAGPSGNIELSVVIPTPKLWSPSTPFLYNLTVAIEEEAARGKGVTDTVQAYFGMRTVTLEDAPGGPAGGSGGRKSLFLNGKPFFAAGWLDQSWWPDVCLTLFFSYVVHASFLSYLIPAADCSQPARQLNNIDVHPSLLLFPSHCHAGTLHSAY
jgi:beta-galactosidase/beta-glucuronidase